MQIKRVAKDEFPVTKQYRDELYKIVVQFVVNSGLKELELEQCLQIWESALHEMRNAKKMEDFQTIKDKSFKQTIIKVNNSNQTTYKSDQMINHEKYRFVMYQDILSLYGIILKKTSLTMEKLQEISEKTDKNIIEMEEFYKEHISKSKKSL